MADIRIDTTVNTAEIEKLTARAKELKNALNDLNNAGQGNSGAAVAIANNLRQVETILKSVGVSLDELDGKFSSLADSSRVFFNSISVSNLKAVTSELQTQLDVQRQLGLYASKYGTTSAAQLQTVTAVLRAQSDEMKRLSGEEEKAGQARARFASQIAPQSSVSGHKRDIEETSRAVAQLIQQQEKLNLEQNKFNQVIAPKSNIEEHTKNLRQASQEQEKLNREQSKFISQIAPRSSVAEHTAEVREATIAQQKLNDEQNKFAQALAPKSNIAEHVEEVKRATQETERLNREQEKFAQQIAPKSNVAEHTAQIQRLRGEQEKLNAEQFKFQQQIAPQSNIAEHIRQIEQEAATRKRAINDMISDLKRLQSEENRAEQERLKFQQQIAPQSQVRYEVDKSGSVRAVKDELNGADGAAFNLGRSLQHVTAIFDGLARGQRGQVVASFTALARDSGVLENTLARLAGAWGVFAAAGVAAAVAVGYALEQSFQRFASIRESTSQLALAGGFSSGQARAESTQRFDTIKKDTQEYAGTARELASELNKLQPAAQSSWKELKEIAIAVGALSREDPAKILKELVTAANAGPGPLAELVTKLYGLQGVLGPTGQGLIEAAKNATNLEEAIKNISTIGASSQINQAGKEARIAQNNILLLALAMGGLGEAAASDNIVTQEFARNITKILEPLKDFNISTQSVTASIAAENSAIIVGNQGLDKRVELLQRMIDAQGGAFRLRGTPGGERAQQAADTLEAQVRQTPQDPAEERRHRLALEHIHAEAQARRADLSAQLDAAEAVAAETRRSETQRLIGAGMDPELAARYAAESEAVDKANNAVKEAQQRVQDEITQNTIAGVRDRISAEAHGSKEKIALQDQIIATTQKEVDAGRATQAQLDATTRARTTFVREANREEYAEAAKGYENQLRSAKGSYDQITNIIAEWRANAAQHFQQGSVDFIRSMEDIERSAILAYRNVVEIAVSSASQLRMANQDIVSGFSHSQDTRIREMGAAGVMAAPALLGQEIPLIQTLARASKEALDNAMKLADAIGDAEQKTKVFWDQWRLGISTQTAIAAVQEKIAGAVKSAYEQTRNAEIAQLKLAEAVAKSRGDLEEIVRLRIQEAQIIGGDKYATPAQKIGAKTDVINALTEEQNRRFGELDRFNSAQERLDRIRIEQNKYSLQAQVSSHDMSKETMAIKESEFTSKVLAEEERRVEAQISNNSLTDTQKEKLYSHLAELYEKDAELQIQAQAKVSDAIEKENEKRSKLLKGAFDEIGSGLEKSLTGLLTGEKGTNTLQDLRKSLTGALVKETFSIGSQYLGKTLAPMLGVKTEGLADTGLGTVLSRALGNLLGITKDTPQDAMKGAAEKIAKAADAQNEAAKLIKPAADGLKEAGDKLKEAADALKGGKGVPSSTYEPPGGATGEGAGRRFARTGGEGGIPAGMPMDMVPVSAQGHTIMMNKAVADRAQALLNELTESGYKITSLSGYRPGATVGDTGRPSMHSAGLAMDINPRENPQAAHRGDPAVTNLPANFGSMVREQSGTWGAGFSRPDPMHVSFQPMSKAIAEVGELGTAARSAATALSSVGSRGGPSTPIPTSAPSSSDSSPAPAYALGGPVGTDTVLAWLTPGERVLTRDQRALYDRMFPSGIERHADGGVAGSHPGLTSLSTESRGFAPLVLEPTNPGLGKGWWILAALGGLAAVAGIASIFGDDKDKKDKELAEKLLKAKDTEGITSDFSRTTTPLDVSKLPKMHSGGMAPDEMVAVLQKGERVIPRFADGGMVGEGSSISPTYSPPARAADSGTSAVRELTGNIGDVSSKMGYLASDVSKMSQSLMGFGRATTQTQTSMGLFSTGLSTIGSAFSGLKSLVGSLGGSGSGDSGGFLGSFGTIFSSIAKILPIFALEQGGIIPSAEGGMIMGGGSLARGGRLAVLHPREMVLPRHLSDAVQGMTEGNGGIQPPPVNFHLHTIDQRSGAQFLMNHRDTIAEMYRSSYRNFNPNVPSY